MNLARRDSGSLCVSAPGSPSDHRSLREPNRHRRPTSLPSAQPISLPPLPVAGITPVYAVMAAVLKDPEDRTTMSLIFANQTEEDILLRAELDQMASSHPDRLKVGGIGKEGCGI